MCNAIPRPFTDRVFNGIAEYLDRYTSQICQVKKKEEYKQKA